MIDYPTASPLQKIAEEVWANGGVVASVCHAPAKFAKFLSNKIGGPIIKGRGITGFTTEAENTMGIFAGLCSWNSVMVEKYGVCSEPWRHLFVLL